MIDIKAKKHDRFTVEFKLGYNINQNIVQSDFIVNTWIFVPHSLDVNPSTYSKERFYRDILSHIRLITPIFLLNEIVEGDAVPLAYLENSFKKMVAEPNRHNSWEYEYHIKMFASIFKSSLRNQIYYIVKPLVEEERNHLVKKIILDVKLILERYRNLTKILNVPTVTNELFSYYQFGDEFMSNIMQRQLFRLLNTLRDMFPELYNIYKHEIVSLLDNEIIYRKSKGYPVVDKESTNKNRNLIFRAGALKKYIESELFLNANKKRDGVLIEQIYFSLAAGVSMVFATAIAFSFQREYGNFTIPLFVALVVSYMLKDRIKDLLRYYYAHKRKNKYFDNKTIIGINEKVIGMSREGFDFINESNVPKEVITLRDRTTLLEAENRNSEEKIILFRKNVQISRDELNANSEYPVSGVNDILRFNLSSFLHKMDDPTTPLYVTSDNGEDYEEIQGIKIYYLNFLMQLKSSDSEEFKRYRIVFNRSGIKEIEELK
ncbi:MAG: hypothetical protein H6Q22_952 [Bacteroidetes bacterium]|nr:hypothetical protein [Bacteroidota bacterium]